MKRNVILIATATIVLLTCGHRVARAQSEELRKFEVGAQFSALSIDKGFGTETQPGFGGRFTYNLTDNFALEAEGNFFPRKSSFSSPRNGGRAIEGLFGVKVGKRFKRVGIFGKARPGLIGFSAGSVELVPTTPTYDPSAPINIKTEWLKHFATDIGVVLEFYPMRRVFTRMDIGDTIIFYGPSTVNTLNIIPPNQFSRVPVTIPGNTTHNVQFSAGVGFRF